MMDDEPRMANDARRTREDNRHQPIAMGHLSDSGDLKCEKFTDRQTDGQKTDKKLSEKLT